MAAKKKKEIRYAEADLIRVFDLNRLVGNEANELMLEWTQCVSFKNAKTNLSRFYELTLRLRSGQAWVIVT